MSIRESAFIIEKQFKTIWKGARVGILLIENFSNPKNLDMFIHIEQKIIGDLKDQFQNRDSLKRHPTIQTYRRYYKNFRKTYHILGQVESHLFKGKPLPKDNPLVSVMFLAELKNFLLTAGHDSAMLKPPITIGCATGEEEYISISGKNIQTKKDDMFIADEIGVLSSVIYGPDKRSRITLNTTSALFTTYAPVEIATKLLEIHLMDMVDIIQALSPAIHVRIIQVF